jgi:hypothetical protein
MGNIKRLSQWLWESWGNILWLGAFVASFALPAWATRVTGVFSHYAPLSWVIAGFIGLGAGAACMATYAWAKGKLVRVRYDKRMLAQGGAVDPLTKTFESKRIYLNEFALPSHPLIEHKTFIDCEIIGPANIILDIGNRVDEPKFPICDTVLMHQDAKPFNGYIFRSCTFRGCSFQRITLLVPIGQYGMAQGVDWLNWITPYPDGEGQLKLALPTPLGEPPPPIELVGPGDEDGTNDQ